MEPETEPQLFALTEPEPECIPVPDPDVDQDPTYNEKKIQKMSKNQK